jgi:hypothetical protein
VVQVGLLIARHFGWVKFAVPQMTFVGDPGASLEPEQPQLSAHEQYAPPVLIRARMLSEAREQVRAIERARRGEDSESSEVYYYREVN